MNFVKGVPKLSVVFVQIEKYGCPIIFQLVTGFTLNRSLSYSCFALYEDFQNRARAKKKRITNCAFFFNVPKFESFPLQAVS